VWIGEPIARQPGEDHDVIIARVREEIAATLTRWRGVSASEARE
jgi:hypothetical protein